MTHSLSPDQLSLLSEPRVRPTDPQTSRDAAKRVEPGAAALERQIMERYATFTRLTDDELVAVMTHAKESSVKTARSRLKNRGLLAASASKRKNAGGCDMTVWKITAAGYEFLGMRMQ